MSQDQVQDGVGEGYTDLMSIAMPKLMRWNSKNLPWSQGMGPFPYPDRQPTFLRVSSSSQTKDW